MSHLLPICYQENIRPEKIGFKINEIKCIASRLSVKAGMWNWGTEWGEWWERGESGRECGGSGWECRDSEWECSEWEWECGESGW